jgi:hypothetical protein
VSLIREGVCPQLIYGATYYFSVTGKSAGDLFGTDIYTDDSELAAASVHAGILAAGQSGIVKVTIRPGQSSYLTSRRNGVQSRSWGKWDSSYSVATANLNVPSSNAEK